MGVIESLRKKFQGSVTIPDQSLIYASRYILHTIKMVNVFLYLEELPGTHVPGSEVDMRINGIFW